MWNRFSAATKPGQWAATVAVLVLCLVTVSCNAQRRNTKGGQAAKMEQGKPDGKTPAPWPMQDGKPVKLSKDDCKTKVTTGLTGKVIWEEGNLMPSPDAEAKPMPKGVKRLVGIFGLATLNDAEVGDAGFYYKLDTPLLKLIQADGNGCFKASMPAGRYTVCVWEDGKWYANSYDERSHINPMEVVEGEVKRQDILINYKAVY